MAKIRNRNVETRKVKAGDLKPHPKNFRMHPTEQGGLLGVLEQVGFVDTLMAVEREDDLLLIDGHLRTETSEVRAQAAIAERGASNPSA